MMQASCLLCQHGTVALEVGDAGSTPADEGATMSGASPDQEIDESVFMKESLKLGPFQTQIIKCKAKPLLGESAHVMITPLTAYEAQSDGAWPLPLLEELCLTQRHAGCRSDMPQPVPVVQHSGISSKKEWNSVLLHGFLQASMHVQKRTCTC